MSSVQLHGDGFRTPRRVSFGKVGLRTAGPPAPDRPPLRLTTQALLRLAKAVSELGLSIESIRLDDITRTDSEDLEEISGLALQALQHGDADRAAELIFEWPDDLIVTDLEVRDPVLRTSLHISRSGVISFGGPGDDSTLIRLNEVFLPRPELYAD